ncbi:MAG: hypothetical protein AABY16_04290 [Nanoarchaeota archaeon]
MERRRPDLSKLARDYNGFDNSLKESGYSRFERGVIYTGLGLGMFAPVAAARYGLFPEAGNGWADLGYWVASVTVNILLSAGLRGIPLIYSGGAGALGGGAVAFGLKKLRERRREKRLRKLERKRRD